MGAFACRTRDEAGTPVERTIDAGSRREALVQLEREGLSAVSITEVRAADRGGDGVPALRDADESVIPGPRVAKKELLQFSLQLSSSLAAGVPLRSGLRSIRQQTRSEAFRAVLAQMIADLEGGLSLSASMRRHPRAFSEVYTGTIEAGEKSGTVEEMFDNLAEYLEVEIETRADVRSALLYPAIVVGMLGLAITVLVVFIVPRFAAFYASFDAELPLATRILIRGSALVSGHLPWVLAAAGVLLWGARLALRLGAVRDALDRVALRIPYVGRLIETAVTLHVVQMLGLFTRAGVPVLEGLQTVANTTSNARMRRQLDAVTAGVAVGRSMAEGMEAEDCLPLAARHMLANGESTGSLERACFAVARHYKKDLRYLTKNAATFIEPLLTLVLAGVVLFVALAAFLPMWDLIKVVGK